MKLHPTYNFLLLDEMEEADKTKGGIWIPERARLPLNQGTIKKMGSNVDKDLFAIGDLVVYGQHSEYRVQVDNKYYLVIDAAQVLLISKTKTKTPPSESNAPELQRVLDED